MTIASVVDRGIGPDGTPQFMTLRGFSPAPATSMLPVRGIGTPSTIAGLVLRGFTPVTATQSVTVCTATTWTGYSLQEDQSPPVAVGDVFYADLVTTPGGYSILVNGDGTVTIDAHGDTTRQYFSADIFDTSLSAFYGGFIVYINNHAPQIQTQPSDIRVLTNNAIATIAFTPTDPAAVHYIIDQDGDPLTGTQVGGTLPTGMSFSSNTLSGTPTVASSGNVTFRFTDTVGEYVDCTMNVIADVGSIVPNVVGKTITQAIADLAAVSLLVDPLSGTDYNAVVPSGDVISQDITAGSRIFTNSTVLLITSLGPIPTGAIVPTVTGLASADAQTALATANLQVDIETVEASAVAGTVIDQSPAAGASVDAFSTVTIYVSTGPEIAGALRKIRMKPRRGSTRIT